MLGDADSGKMKPAAEFVIEVLRFWWNVVNNESMDSLINKTNADPPAAITVEMPNAIASPLAYENLVTISSENPFNFRSRHPLLNPVIRMLGDTGTRWHHRNDCQRQANASHQEPADEEQSLLRHPSDVTRCASPRQEMLPRQASASAAFPPSVVNVQAKTASASHPRSPKRLRPHAPPAPA